MPFYASADERNMVCNESINIEFNSQSKNDRGSWINSGDVTARIKFEINDVESVFAFLVVDIKKNIKFNSCNI